jgi:hypothetical protein
MKTVGLGLVLAFFLAASILAQSSRVDLKKPLVLARQGSFFVGGERRHCLHRRLDAAGSAAATSPSTRCTCSIKFHRTARVICRW